MRVVQFRTVIFGDMRCSLRYDLAFVIVWFVLIISPFVEPTAVEVFRLVFQVPGGLRSTGRRQFWHCTGPW
jgi:hypothetical protein